MGLLSNMDGAFVKIERMPARPAYIVGERLYKELKSGLEKQLISDGLNSNMLYKNEHGGYEINFYNHDGTELTTGNWLIAQEIIEESFVKIKQEHADKPEFESLRLIFIDADELGKRKVVIKPQLN